MTSVEYFLSANYNQVYMGERFMHFFMKYKWQTNCTWSSLSFAIKLAMQMAEVLTKKAKGKPHPFPKTWISDLHSGHLLRIALPKFQLVHWIHNKHCYPLRSIEKMYVLNWKPCIVLPNSKKTLKFIFKHYDCFKTFWPHYNNSSGRDF